VLETERLRLRRPLSTDLDAFVRVFGDPEVMRFVGAGRPLARGEVAELLVRMQRRLDEDGFGQLVVERRADGLVLGRVGLLPLDPETWQFGSRRELGPSAEIEIGWTLARDSWGHGYAIEAARAVVAWARDELRLRRLVSIIQVGNDASIRLARRLGEAHERDIVTSFGRRAHLYALAL
jgi:RimJ/RimL family protein N-acetyltransferase